MADKFYYLWWALFGAIMAYALWPSWVSAVLWICVGVMLAKIDEIFREARHTKRQKEQNERLSS